MPSPRPTRRASEDGPAQSHAGPDLDADAIRDAFAAFGTVRVRRMFGGQGIFHDGLMFALEADGTLYLKADEADAPAYRQAGCTQFSYRKGDRDVAMNYWSVPLAALEEPEIMARWARMAHACARHRAARASQGRHSRPLM